MGFKFAIDRGGTFTDVYVVCPDGDVRVLKLLSSDPGNYDDASIEAIRQILETSTGDIYPKGSPIKGNLIDSVRIGTTLATNALLERMGEKCALAVTAGFKDVLMIGNQARPNIFDLKIDMPQVLYSDVIEIEERIVVKHSECELYNGKIPETSCITGAKVHVVTPLNVEKARSDLERVFSSGIRSIAVVLLHSYLFPNHENEIGRIAKEVGFTHVSLSHIVMPMTRIVPRGLTATVDAYLTPCIQKYIRDFHSGFLVLESENMHTLFMQSDGGLSPADGFLGSRAILSGPAGGVIGYAMTSYNAATGQPVVGFDMGGTSTDVSRYAGELEHVFESTTAGVSIQAPQLNIMTVAAGGGSLLNFRGGLYTVGPESAGADPGPVAYGRQGGLLALTDANLVLGRLLPSRFPAIFGPDRKAPLDQGKALKAMLEMTELINAYSKEHNNQQAPVSVHEVALGFVRVANETMCRPIRFLTQAKGYDTTRHMLVCFGGAGGQHASSIARLLGIKTVQIHRYAGVLSAYGIALADVVCEKQSPCQQSYEPGNFSKIDNLINNLVAAATDHLRDYGFINEQIGHEIFLNMRYEGTDGALMCRSLATEDAGDSVFTSHGDFAGAFVQRYKREFGFTLLNRAILVDDVRVRGFAKTDVKPPKPLRKAPMDETPPSVEVTKTYFEEGLLDTRVYLLDNLSAGHRIDGPSIIVSSHSTVLVEPNCVAEITPTGDIQIQIDCVSLRRDEVGQALDPIQLSIFSHRFMSIAEQMGRVLQRTAISTNIKERLDFSCALFDNTGGLVANAPHIPVHLGAMQHAVEYQIAAEKNQFHDGDVLLSNHPCAGGSHLPDLTVITPVFIDDAQGVAFFVACRGHHADIGGSTPGSMPPHSKSIFEEGAAFKTFYLVKNGQFQEEAVTAALMEPRLHPGCSGTRRLSDNLSDLKAQVAANHRGVHLLKELVGEYTFPVVLAYMKHIQDNAETSVRYMLRNARLKATDYDSTHNETLNRIQADVGKDADYNIDRAGGPTENPSSLVAVDYKDDGTQIKLTVDVDLKTGSAHFDFSGTGPEVLGNTNLPRAVLLSCIVYTLRCLVGGDMCLNHGCLKPIRITVPDGTILSASLDAAVVGGNVLTSQRIVDVILAAFRTCAASQGCMNNITFGNEKFGYYETVAGGAGAGPGWHGQSGVHTHMTNTRITDPEILEQRYPVVLEQFSLRSGSGGSGTWRGGDGLVRRLKFRSPVKLSVLCERRVIPPYGLFGGEPGQRGLNLLLRANSKTPVNLGGKQMVEVNAGDVFILHTPGGGGYGAKTETGRLH